MYRTQFFGHRLRSISGTSRSSQSSALCTLPGRSEAARQWRWCAETSVRRGPGHRDGRRGMIST